jgi:hypothetical protein
VIGYPLQPYFLKKMRIPYKVYHLMYVTKLSCKCRRKEKEKEETKKKIRKTIKVEEKKIYIIYKVTYLLSNDAKNLTRSKD